MSLVVRLTAVLALAASALLAESPERPACTSTTRSQFWPEAANSDPAAARSASQKGELCICTREGWRYRWRPVSIHWKALQKPSDRNIAQLYNAPRQQ